MWRQGRCGGSHRRWQASQEAGGAAGSPSCQHPLVPFTQDLGVQGFYPQATIHIQLTSHHSKPSLGTLGVPALHAYFLGSNMAMSPACLFSKVRWLAHAGAQ